MTATPADQPADQKSDLGRDAAQPSNIPLRGWIQVAKRLWQRIGRDNLTLVAAGVAFYAMLALFPAIASMIAIYGLVFDPAEAGQQIDYFRGILPDEAFDIVAAQFTEVAAGSGKKQGVGAAMAIALSLWSSAKGARSLITALNIAYDERETRNLIRQNIAALMLTAFFIILAIAGLSVILLIPLILELFGLGIWTEWLMATLRWPLIMFIALFALAWTYRYGPSRRNARWRWVIPGVVLAVVLWVLAAYLFSLYVNQLANYSATYGSVGAIVVLLMWFYVSAFVIILGAELNAELERQTAQDTTWHGEQPMGQRGAYVADNLPEDGPSAANRHKQ